MGKEITEWKGAEMKTPKTVSLPPEWSTFIPPAMVNTVEVQLGGIRGTGPEWNPQWLAGLEKYVRAIVQDELQQKKVKARK